jgi:pimeloyl-ACP methyl ester carboxylesterase
VIMLDDVGHAPHLEATATVARVLRELSRNR